VCDSFEDERSTALKVMLHETTLFFSSFIQLFFNSITPSSTHNTIDWYLYVRRCDW